jgi:hypothetical protein
VGAEGGIGVNHIRCQVIGHIDRERFEREAGRRDFGYGLHWYVQAQKLDRVDQPILIVAADVEAEAYQRRENYRRGKATDRVFGRRSGFERDLIGVAAEMAAVHAYGGTRNPEGRYGPDGGWDLLLPDGRTASVRGAGSGNLMIFPKLFSTDLAIFVLVDPKPRVFVEQLGFPEVSA